MKTLHQTTTIVLLGMLLCACSKKDSNCATTDDCQKGFSCIKEQPKHHGELVKGVCKDSCTLNMTQCRVHGLCTYKEGKCVATSKAECSRTVGCQKWGFCSEKDGKCVALTDADCRYGSMCKKGHRVYNQCFALNGDCVSEKVAQRSR